MKKFYLVFCFILIGTAANAQFINSYGIKLGMGITNHTWQSKSFDFDFGWDNNTGISARAFADFLNFSYFNIEGEIGYSQKGARQELFTVGIGRPETKVRDIETRLHYMSAALMVKGKFNSGIFTPYLIAGPQLNYLVGKDGDKLLYKVYDKFKNTVWGYTAGAGSEINFMNLNFLLEYRFEKDIDNNNSTIGGWIIKNYSHSVLVGIQL